MRKNRHISPSVRFRRWSRKAYAAFLSLHLEVTIGCVCRSIADAAQLKVKSASRMLLTAAHPLILEREREETEADDDELCSIGGGLLCPCVTQQKGEVCPANKTITNRYFGDEVTSERGFYSLMTSLPRRFFTL